MVPGAGWYMILVLSYVDVALDSINRDALWKLLSRYGCPSNFTTILALLHDKMRETALINGNKTEPVTIRTGVKQGCVIAPTLFTIYLCALLFLVRDRLLCGVEIDYRLDGKPFNLSRLKTKTKLTDCRYRPSVC